MNGGEVISLILLDLSAAFDTVDHSIILTRLQNSFSLDGFFLDWFSSHLSSRSQAVSVNNSISAFSTLSCGVPQGSVSSIEMVILPHPNDLPNDLDLDLDLDLNIDLDFRHNDHWPDDI